MRRPSALMATLVAFAGAVCVVAACAPDGVFDAARSTTTSAGGAGGGSTSSHGGSGGSTSSQGGSGGTTSTTPDAGNAGPLAAAWVQTFAANQGNATTDIGGLAFAAAGKVVLAGSTTGAIHFEGDLSVGSNGGSNTAFFVELEPNRGAAARAANARVPDKGAGAGYASSVHAVAQGTSGVLFAIDGEDDVAFGINAPGVRGKPTSRAFFLEFDGEPTELFSVLAEGKGPFIQGPSITALAEQGSARTVAGSYEGAASLEDPAAQQGVSLDDSGSAVWGFASQPDGTALALLKSTSAVSVKSVALTDDPRRFTMGTFTTDLTVGDQTRKSGNPSGFLLSESLGAQPKAALTLLPTATVGGIAAFPSASRPPGAKAFAVAVGDQLLALVDETGNLTPVTAVGTMPNFTAVAVTPTTRRVVVVGTVREHVTLGGMDFAPSDHAHGGTSAFVAVLDDTLEHVVGARNLNRTEQTTFESADFVAATDDRIVAAGKFVGRFEQGKQDAPNENHYGTWVVSIAGVP